jgi:hypothetical protein
MNDRTKDYLRSLAQRRPDLVSSGDVERFASGIPGDDEFGVLQPAHGGCHLEMNLPCAQWGNQKLEITVEGGDALSGQAKQLLRHIRSSWSLIWPAAFREWVKEYPAWDMPEGEEGAVWVLEATLPSPADGNEWELSISGNAASTMIALEMDGADVVSAELI